MSFPTPLNYAPPPPLHRRRAFHRWILIAFLLGIALVSLCWLISMRGRMQLLYWQYRCLIYTPAAGQIALVVDHAGVIRQCVPQEWVDFYSRLSPPGFYSDGTVFLHELKKPNGQRRLVAVDVVILARQDEAVLPFARVIVPGDLQNWPKEKAISGAASQLTLAGPTPLTIFAGTVDPGDSSRFTFRAVVQGQEVNYDGWLRDDDVVVINPRRVGK